MKRRWWSESLFLLLILILEPAVYGHSCYYTINATQDFILNPSDTELFSHLCSWSIVAAAPNHVLRVNSVYQNSSDFNNLRVEMDGESVYSHKTCKKTKCLSVGKHLEIQYQILVNFTATFAVNYSVVRVDECAQPQVPANGRIIEIGTGIGEKVVFECDSPYVTDQVTESYCLLNNSLIPTWNQSSPVCFLPATCSKITNKMEIDSTEEKLVVNPNFPQVFHSKKSRTCSWEVSLRGYNTSVLQAELEHANIQGKGSSLNFYDGKFDEKLLLLSVSGSSGVGSFLLPASSRLLIRLVMLNERKLEKKDFESSSALFRIRLLTVARRCPPPVPPQNGDVRGAVLDSAHSQQQQLVYMCNQNYFMNGSDTSVCLENGEWNSTTPFCDRTQFFTDLFLPLSPVTSKPHLKERPDQQDTEEKNTQWKFESSRNVSTESPVWDEYPEEEAELIDVVETHNVYDDHEDEREDEEEEEESEEMDAKYAVALGIGIPSVLGLLAGISFAIYRKLYPVRMNLGRRFGTFENPVYQSSKRNPGRADSLLPNSSLAQVPAELDRLTTHSSR